MKIPRGLPFVFISLLFLITSCIDKDREAVPRYDFIHPAYLNLEFTNATGSIYLTSWHWNKVVQEEIETDSLLVVGDGNISLEINVNKPQLINFSFNETRFDFFFVPRDTTEVHIDFSKSLDSVIPEFTGRYAIVNRYYFEKHDRFSTWDFFLPRAMFTQSSLDATELEKNNDDLTDLELRFLYDFAGTNPIRPKWFQEYEKQSILLKNAYFKENSIFYRKAMLGIDDSIPENYYSFINNIDINSKTALITDYFFHYLSDIESFQFRKTLKNHIEIVDKTMADQKYIDYVFNYMDRLDPNTRELYSLFKLFFNYKLSPKKQHWIDSLRKYVVNPDYKFLLDTLDNNKFRLQKNTKAPGFYLQDNKGEFRTLKEFKGKVVLLNFWTTSCQPCLKEFPSEDSLVEKFKGSDFQLISICLNSYEDIWKMRIKGHSKIIVYLFAKENWNKILKDNYKVNAYPTFVLIDKEGKIINEKPSRPSNPKLVDEIELLLEQDKKTKSEQ